MYAGIVKVSILKTRTLVTCKQMRLLMSLSHDCKASYARNTLPSVNRGSVKAERQLAMQKKRGDLTVHRESWVLRSR